MTEALHKVHTNQKVINPGTYKNDKNDSYLHNLLYPQTLQSLALREA